MPIEMRTTLLTIASVVTLSACAGSGDGLDANGRPLGEGSGGGPLTADFASIQDNVLTPICTACHAGAGAPQGLRLDAANSYDLLVGVPSSEVPSLFRVKPGDPANSYLVQKLEGRASVGARMPFGGPYLDASTIAVIRQWITDGAQRPVAFATRAAFAIASSSPATGDTLTEAPARIVVGFTHELDRTRIDASSLQLVRESVADGATTDEPIAVRLSVSDANPAALVVTPFEPLTRGHYLLRASGTSIVDLAGTPLDGADGREAELANFRIGGAP